MKRNRNNIRKTLAAMASAGLPVIASAQTRDVSSLLSTFQSTLKTNADSIVNIVSIILGLAAIVMLIPTFTKLAKNDPSSSDGMLKIATYFVVAYIFLQVVRMTMLS